MDQNRKAAHAGPYFSAAHGRYVENEWRSARISQPQQYTSQRRPRPQRSTVRVRFFLVGVLVGVVIGLLSGGLHG